MADRDPAPTAPAPSSPSAASGLRVLEVGESIAAATAGMVLADYGADVVMLEPPGGSRLRRLPAFAMWGRAKRAVALDLATGAGRRRAAELAAEADVAVVALEPAVADRLGVDGERLWGANPRLVHCEITGFGRGHPLSHLAGHDPVVAAAAGRAHELSVLFEGRRPAYPSVPVATHGATMLALGGIFAALVERERTGKGQRLQTSLLAALGVYDLSGWAPGADRALRLADVPFLPYAVARTADGVWLQFGQNAPRLFRALLRVLDLEGLLAEPRFATAPSVADPADARELRAALLARIAERSWPEWQDVFGSEPDIAVEPFSWPGDALVHPQLVHTGDSRELVDPHLGPTRQLGPLATMSATPAVAPTPAPGLPGPSAAPGWRAPAGGPPRPADHSSRPLLAGVTVLEMATWIATPMATALLADLGARVVKVEPLEGDPMRRHGPAGLKCVQGKESIAVDLKDPRGREVVHRLAERADVLVHNYRPGVPERLGIDEATLRALNPGLIHVYAASYGSTGPMSARPAFHVTAGALSGGALAQAGRPGPPGAEVPLDADEAAWWSQHLSRCNESNPDFNAALALAAAIAMALYARERTGSGQAVETRMMLSNAYTLSEHFVDYEGRPPRVLPDADLLGLHALVRMYPADGGWVMLAAPDQADFERLAEVLGSPHLVSDDRFADADRRRANDTALADELGRILATRAPAVWQQRLGGAGVACVTVHDGPHASYVMDADWAEPLGFVEMSAPGGLGPYRRYGRPVRSRHDLGPPGAADRAGAQTRAILAELGDEAATVEELMSARTVGEPAPSEHVTP